MKPQRQLEQAVHKKGVEKRGLCCVPCPCPLGPSTRSVLKAQLLTAAPRGLQRTSDAMQPLCCRRAITPGALGTAAVPKSDLGPLKPPREEGHVNLIAAKPLLNLSTHPLTCPITPPSRCLPKEDEAPVGLKAAFPRTVVLFWCSSEQVALPYSSYRDSTALDRA